MLSLTAVTKNNLTPAEHDLAVKSAKAAARRDGLHLRHTRKDKEGPYTILAFEDGV